MICQLTEGGSWSTPLQAVLKANPGMKSSSKRPNLLMTAGIGVTERDEKKEHLYSLMGEPALLSSFSCASAFAKAQVVGTVTAVVACCDGVCHGVQIRTSRTTS